MKSAGNTVFVLNSLIKKLKVPVSCFTVEKKLLEHPDYPSMLSLSDCLTLWNVPNEAFKIDKETCDIKELPFPFIAHLKREGGEFVLIQGIKDDAVIFSNEKESSGALKLPEFLEFWDGTVLFAQKAEESGERNYRQELAKGFLNLLRVPFLISIILIGIFLGISSNNSNFPVLLLLGLKLIGITISTLLLMYSINANNPFIQNLCSLGKKNNCNAILKSDAAKITSWLSWSEVGMFYFAGTFTCLIVNPISVTLLAWLNLIGLPYTIYSIGYQFKLKNWCFLCCSVQLLLWLEGLTFFFNYPVSGFSFTLAEWIALVFCFLLPIAIWGILKPLLLKSGQTEPLKRQLKKFKYNSTLFYQLLSNQPRYLVSEDLMPITFGHQDADTVITIVSNPFCGPCATSHKLLDNWLETRGDIQLKVVFTTANQDNDSRTLVARHVAALSLLPNKDIVKTALDDWYNQSNKNYKTWAERYPVSFSDKINEVTERQKAWCEMAEIQFTPTILINGYKLVEPYQLEDIKFLLS